MGNISVLDCIGSLCISQGDKGDVGEQGPQGETVRNDA